MGPRLLPRRLRRETRPADLAPVEGESAPWIIRTALCTEVRGGVLRVFMPPQHYLEDYLELTAAIEDTAAQLGLTTPQLGHSSPRLGDSSPRLGDTSPQLGNVVPQLGISNSQ